jgi:hypothetical protein
MKRRLLVAAVTVLAVTSVSGCRGGSSWWNRGALCGAQADPCATAVCPPDCDPMYAPGIPMGTTMMGAPMAPPTTMEALPAN